MKNGMVIIDADGHAVDAERVSQPLQVLQGGHDLAAAPARDLRVGDADGARQLGLGQTATVHASLQPAGETIGLTHNGQYDRRESCLTRKTQMP